ncbi:MAG TPA: hypothetical protein VK846_12555 [Candidatus Limnocylindria bacterium]|nr:hypothetical protein [Candidatus Limnocylindria bacterium]
MKFSTKTLQAFLGIVATLVAILAGVITLTNYFNSPSLFATAKLTMYSLSPEIRRDFSQALRSNEVLTFLSEQSTNASSTTNLVESLRSNLATNSDGWRYLYMFQHVLPESFMDVVIANKGNDVAKDLRVLLSGKGEVDFSETDIFDRRQQAVPWTNQIVIGEIRPRSELHLRIWSGDFAFLFRSFSRLNPVLHHSKGSVPLREAREFYGVGPDLAARWINSGNGIQAGTIFFLFAAGVFLMRSLWTHLERSKPTTPAKRSRRSRSGSKPAPTLKDAPSGKEPDEQ